jgi:hypothetical protein
MKWFDLDEREFPLTSIKHVFSIATWQSTRYPSYHCAGVQVQQRTAV